MPTIPTLAGPVLVEGKYAVFIDGFPLGYFGDAKIPQMKVKPTTLNTAGMPYEQKFPSGMFDSVDNLELEAYQAIDGGVDTSIETWLKQCADARTLGASGPPQAAKKDIVVEQLGADNTVIKTHTMHGCFLLEPGAIELKAGSADAVKRKTVIAVEWVE